MAAGEALDGLPALLQPPEDLLEDVAAELDRCLVEDPPAVLKDGHIIAPGVDPELDELVSISRGGKEAILAIEARERERTGISGLKIKYNRVFGYTIEVSRAKAAEVPDDYVRKQTLVNVERYVTPELAEYENKVLTAEEKRISLEEKLFVALRAEVAASEARLGALAERLAMLDLLAGFAEVSAQQDYCRPVVDDSDDLVIEEGRHPVVEQLLGPGRFVPNDEHATVPGPHQCRGVRGKGRRRSSLLVAAQLIGRAWPARTSRLFSDHSPTRTPTPASWHPSG